MFYLDVERRKEATKKLLIGFALVLSADSLVLKH